VQVLPFLFCETNYVSLVHGTTSEKN